jgi:hypothetical protein
MCSGTLSRISICIGRVEGMIMERDSENIVAYIG